MHRRHQPTNIPTEIVRTLVAIAETGSFSKAGEKLNLSQPAISAQVKRLQTLVGGAVFQKQAGGGVEFTSIGRLALLHARRFLQANDQILALGGAAPDFQPIRLGISAYYAGRFLESASGPGMPTLSVHCDRSSKLVKGLNEGYLDVVCGLLRDACDDAPAIVWNEEMVWARRRDFVLSPGMPLPIVVWPADFDEFSAVEALERAGVAYRIAFASADLQSRIAAVATGIGLMILPKRMLRDPLVAAHDYYLPKLTATRAGVRVRPGFEVDGLEILLDLFRKMDRDLCDDPAKQASHRGARANSDVRSIRATA